MKLRTRLRVAIASLGIAMVITYAGVLPVFVLKTEDWIFKAELEAWSERVENDPAVRSAQDAVDLGPGVSYIPPTDIRPESLGTWLDTLSPGPHEFNDGPLPGLRTQDALVWVFDDSLGGHILFDVTEFEVMEESMPPLYFWVFWIGGTCAAIGAVLGWTLTTRVSRSFDRLDDLARRGLDDLDSWPEDLNVRTDELGAVSRTLHASLTRSRRALDRERAFSRNASHELRTPLAAIRSTADLIFSDQNPSRERATELHGRLVGAIDDAERRVSTFLWLSREERPTEPDEWQITTLVREMAPEGSTLYLETEHETDAAEAAARAALSALLENADRHGTGGLTISTTPSGFMIQNDYVPNSVSSPHGGFGLEVVGELAQRLGWTLTTREDGERFTVEVTMEPKA